MFHSSSSYLYLKAFKLLVIKLLRTVLLVSDVISFQTVLKCVGCVSYDILVTLW